MNIEDQVFPKRCGHMAGKEVIDAGEMAGKVRACADVRDRLDKDFIVNARTDAAGRQLPGGEFRSEFLHAYLNSERLQTHKAVQLRRADDQFTADAMDFDNVERVLTLRGHVRGVLQAKPAP